MYVVITKLNATPGNPSHLYRGYMSAQASSISAMAPALMMLPLCKRCNAVVKLYALNGSTSSETAKIGTASAYLVVNSQRNNSCLKKKRKKNTGNMMQDNTLPDLFMSLIILAVSSCFWLPESCI